MTSNSYSRGRRGQSNQPAAVNAIPLFTIIIVVVVVVVAVALDTSSSKRMVLASPHRRGAANAIAMAMANESPEFDDSLDPMDPITLPMAPPSPIAAAASSSNIQCEPITIKLCSQMAYQSTRMPNFFQDSNQIEAVDRALQYQDLVSSRCSPHVHAYICELLTPVCLEDSREAMKRFEIYPCRSFCRRVKRDCELELFKLNEQFYKQGGSSLLPGFSCEQLPFESNGGNGTLRGPCHETPEPSQSQQLANKSSYSPYQPSFDSNIPPFITDTSRLDSTLLMKPTGSSGSGSSGDSMNRFQSMNNLPQPPATTSWSSPAQDQQSILDQPNKQSQPTSNQPKQTSSSATQPDQQFQPSNNNNNNKQQAQTLMAQIQSFGQSVLWTLIRYSNVLSIATVLCLLAALNSKRLRRLKTYLSFSPSSSIKSSSSSSAGGHHHHHHQQQHHHHHRLHLDGNGKIMSGGYPNHHHHQKSSLSPSSSSRSLMLIAGSNKQPPAHQLVPASMVSDHGLTAASDPSRKLLLDGLQKTLINVNGTLERQKQQHLQNSSRYLIMQPSGVQQQQQQHSSVDGRTAMFKQHSDKQQLFNTLDSHSSQSNQYDYIQVASDQASSSQPTLADHNNNGSGGSSGRSNNNGSFSSHLTTATTRQQQQSQQQQQLYSNILLTSPSHQVLLLGGNQQHQMGGPNISSQSRLLQAARSQCPQQQPPCVGPHHAPYFSASLTPYADPTGCLVSGGGGGGSLVGDSPHSQRSFQRRTRKSSGGGGRFPVADIHQAGQRMGGQLKEFISPHTRPSAGTGGGGGGGGYTSAASSASSSSSSAISPPTSGDHPSANLPLSRSGSRRRVG